MISRFSELGDGKTLLISWISINITSYVLRKKSCILTFLNKINSKWFSVKKKFLKMNNKLENLYNTYDIFPWSINNIDDLF